MNKHVLVVEDNADAREMLSELLQILGHRVTEAEDGTAGANAVQTETPDVAFIDLGLPGMPGLELARHIRTVTGRTIYLVALTGYGEPSDRRSALDAGFDEHLVKPVGLDQIGRVLETAEKAAAGAA